MEVKSENAEASSQTTRILRFGFLPSVGIEQWELPTFTSEDSSQIETLNPRNMRLLPRPDFHQSDSVPGTGFAGLLGSGYFVAVGTWSIWRIYVSETVSASAPCDIAINEIMGGQKRGAIVCELKRALVKIDGTKYRSDIGIPVKWYIVLVS